MGIKENILSLRNELKDETVLIAVSKTKPVSQILEAYDAGQRDFGENYVQELVSKQSELPKDIRWHFIGHLQSNKVKLILPFVHLIHGIDSVKLLKEVNKESQKLGKATFCLLQLHIAEEETKFGFDSNELEELLKSGSLKELEHVNICGLMGMATNTEDTHRIKADFKKITNLAAKFPFLKTLSFGMSGDYRPALEMGSNMIRVGSLIFGERQYLK